MADELTSLTIAQARAGLANKPSLRVELLLRHGANRAVMVEDDRAVQVDRSAAGKFA